MAGSRHNLRAGYGGGGFGKPRDDRVLASSRRTKGAFTGIATFGDSTPANALFTHLHVTAAAAPVMGVLEHDFGMPQ